MHTNIYSICPEIKIRKQDHFDPVRIFCIVMKKKSGSKNSQARNKMNYNLIDMKKCSLP